MGRASPSPGCSIIAPPISSARCRASAMCPILGQLFRSKNVNHSTVELMVVVTPYLVDPLNDTTSPTLPKLPVPLLDPEQFDKKTGKQKPATQPQTGAGGKQ